MIMAILDSKFGYAVIGIILGVVIGYFSMQSKVVTEHKKVVAYETTITTLNTKIAKLTKIHTVTVVQGTTTTTTSDTIISSNTDTTGGTNSHAGSQTDATTVTEINVKKLLVMPFFKINGRVDAAGGFVGYDVWKNIGLAVGGKYDWSNEKNKYGEIYFGVPMKF